MHRNAAFLRDVFVFYSVFFFLFFSSLLSLSSSSSSLTKCVQKLTCWNACRASHMHFGNWNVHVFFFFISLCFLSVTSILVQLVLLSAFLNDQMCFWYAFDFNNNSHSNRNYGFAQWLTASFQVGSTGTSFMMFELNCLMVVKL